MTQNSATSSRQKQKPNLTTGVVVISPTVSWDILYPLVMTNIAIENGAV